MNRKILNLLEIDQSIFNNALIIVFDTLEELYLKGGLAYVDSNKDDTDLMNEYVKIRVTKGIAA